MQATQYVTIAAVRDPPDLQVMEDSVVQTLRFPSPPPGLFPGSAIELFEEYPPD